MERILVTGGNGLVGRCFEGPEYFKISSSPFDLRNKGDVEDAFYMSNPKGVIHCAAKVGGVLGNMRYKGEFFYDNIMINTNVIEQARKSGVQKLIAFLSTCVFPDDVEYPLSPEKIHLGKPHISNDAYAYAKRMSDIQIRSYREQYNLNYFSVIPTNIYGPGDYYNLENGHVVPTLIHKFYLAKLMNTPVQIWGSGKSLREFIYSEDVAKLTRMLYDDYQGSEPVILSTSSEISIMDLVDVIKEAFNFRGEIKFDTSKPDGQFRKPSDNSVIKSLYPDFKFTGIEEGIKKSVEWFTNNYPNNTRL
jgi:GDP-L-fucose synthase